jgi:DNA primase
VIFPIRDAQTRDPRTIAFGGRILPEWASDDAPKYYNSPETPLFSKNRQVYGLDQAFDAVTKAKNIVVVEGYTDCIIAHQFGVKNVVAVLGTALGERHIGLLKRFADSITLVLDGDTAGQKRTNEILELFVAAQVDLRILTLPENLDPCDFVLTHGGEAFGQLLAQAVDALEHKIATVTKGLDLTADTHQANEVLEDLLGTLARAPRLGSGGNTAAELRESQVLSRLARKFVVPEEQMRRRIAELRRRAPRPAAAAEPRIAPRVSFAQLDPWDREVLELVIGHSEIMPQLIVAIRSDDLASPLSRTIYNKCLEINQSGVAPDFDRLMLEAEDADVKCVLVDLEEDDSAKSACDSAQRLREVLASFQRRKEDAEHRNLIVALQQGHTESSQADEYLNKLMAELKTRHGRSEPTEG